MLELFGVEIRPYSLLAFAIGLSNLTHGIFVYLSDRRAKLNIIYFLFCLSLCFWLFNVAALTSSTLDHATDLLLARLLYSGVVFAPTLALHFVQVYLGLSGDRREQRNLLIAYIATCVFLWLTWTSPLFITGIYQHPFGKYPRCGPLHVVHTGFLLVTALYSIRLLLLSLRKMTTKDRRYYEHRYLLLGLCFVLLASIDFLQNWGAPFLPIGCVFVGIFVAMTTYAIFRHQLLGITAAVRGAATYTIITSIIVCVYFTAVYLTGLVIGDVVRPDSVGSMLVVLIILTLLFRPLESMARVWVGRLFAGEISSVLEDENRRLRSEMLKQDQMRSVATLAAGMAHEIKNPLTAIKTFTEHLPARASDPMFIEKFRRVVSQEVDKIDSIVRQVLEFSRPQARISDDVRLGELILATLELLSSQLMRNNIVVERTIHRSLPVIRGDRKLLQQALLNILLNAIEAMPAGGRLQVEAVNDDKVVRISITDTGCGITASALPRIFDPFYSDKPAGTGLGLSIVKSIIDQHGGKISVRSVVGQGTEFALTLPL